MYDLQIILPSYYDWDHHSNSNKHDEQDDAEHNAKDEV